MDPNATIDQHVQPSTNTLGGTGNSSGKFSGDHDSECSSVTSDSAHGGG